MRGWKSFERNEGSQELEGWFCNEVGGGWEIFKVSIAFLSSENNIFILKNCCYTVLYKKQIILAA